MKIVLSDAGLSSTLGFNKEEITTNILNQKTNFAELPADAFCVTEKVSHTNLYEALISHTYGIMNFKSTFRKPHIQETGHYLLEQIKNFNITDKQNCGLYLGQSIAHTKRMGRFYIKVVEDNPINAFDILFGIPSIDIYSIVDIMKIYGPTLHLIQECSSSALAVGQAFQTIRGGFANEIIAGGSDNCNPYLLNIFQALGILSKQNKPDIFSTERDGIVVGEGAGAVLIKNEHYLNDKEKPLAEIVDFKSYNSYSSVAPDKALIEKILMEFLKNNNLTAKDIDIVSLHATGTQIGDINETKAVESVLPETPIVALKSYFGHTMGGASITELVLTLWMMEMETVFPIANLKNIDPECGNINYTREPLKRHIKYAIILSSGLGGNHTGILLKNLQD
jgi:3-oxoacyl-[acyl-carrier-protein] synthase II